MKDGHSFEVELQNAVGAVVGRSYSVDVGSGCRRLDHSGCTYEVAVLGRMEIATALESSGGLEYTAVHNCGGVAHRRFDPAIFDAVCNLNLMQRSVSDRHCLAWWWRFEEF